mgnify:FL=1
MKLVIQRVSKASASIGGEVHSSIGSGLLILIGITEHDTSENSTWLANKASNLRIFPDGQGNMNQSIQDIGGEALIVSQFTLHALTKKGNRPSFIRAAKPEVAIPLYNHFIEHMAGILNDKVKTGVFGADMQIELVNDGPLTLIIDTDNKA